MTSRNVLFRPRLSNMLRNLLSLSENVVQSRFNPRDGLREERTDAPFGFRTRRVLRHCASSVGRVLVSYSPAAVLYNAAHGCGGVCLAR